MMLILCTTRIDYSYSTWATVSTLKRYYQMYKTNLQQHVSASNYKAKALPITESNRLHLWSTSTSSTQKATKVQRDLEQDSHHKNGSRVQTNLGHTARL